jgi:predicted transcriptional regulator
MKLGELEKLLLNYLWTVKIANAKQVYLHFEKTRGGTLNTIQSTLDRLFKKGLLSRKKYSHAFAYSPAVERKDLLGSLITDITQELAQNDSEAILEAFVDISSQMDSLSLDRLESLIANRKNES